MADVVVRQTGMPRDVAEIPRQRWYEVRAGEHAPEIAVIGRSGAQAVPVVFGATPAPIATHGTAAAVALNTWTTVASRTVPTGGPAEDVEAFNCDIAGILDVGMRVRLLIGGVTVWQETVGTRANSATYPKLRANAGQVVAVQGLHGEATAQDMAATVVTRPIS